MEDIWLEGLMRVTKECMNRCSCNMDHFTAVNNSTILRTFYVNISMDSCETSLNYRYFCFYEKA